jgi:hypothetical protein
MKPILFYQILLAMSGITGIVLYGVMPDRFEPQFLFRFSFLPFFLFVTGVHGLLAHVVSSKGKSLAGSFLYPLFMGALFVVLLMVHLFLIMPAVCPDLFPEAY